ncbi:MAG: hypothetical protein GC180_01980 [Bacteroidetes bacterium]|nr:hypothetical protein [Bacteroidota bacterium]
MDLKDVVSIAGIGGLHKIVGQRPTGLIVETLDAEKKRFPTNLSQKISILDDISIYTIDGEARLKDVMLKIREAEKAGTAIPGKKDSEDKIRSFVGDILPNYDKERVYISDLKKLVQWYGILNKELDWDALAKGGEASDAEENKDGKEAKEVKKTTKAKAAAPKKTAAPKSANVKSRTNTPRKTGGA